MTEALILGCGRVGSETAKALVKNRCKVTVVDNNTEQLLALQSMYDLRTVTGSAADPAILKRAGGENAEIVIAVTSQDEVNLVACRLCAILFGAQKRIARLRNNALGDSEISPSEGFGINHIFCPEQIIANNICDTISHPGCLSVQQFSKHKAVLATIRVSAGGELAGDTIGNIRAALSEVDFRVISVYRDHALHIPQASTRLFVGDEISVIIDENSLDTLLAVLTDSGSYRNVLIAGGGNIGERVAKQILQTSQVKIIDASPERCAYLSTVLDDTLVLKGTASNEDMLREENIADTDIYCALTNDDEENVLSSMLAKHLGAKRNITLVNRSAYMGILPRLLDNVVSPSELSIGAILAHIREGDTGVVHSLHQGRSEVIETMLHGNSKNSAIIGRTVKDIKWPANSMLGALIRKDRLIIAHDHTLLQEDDRLIIFISGGKAIREISKLLRVSLSYF